MPVYEEVLPPRDHPLTLVELGVDTGASMRLWLEWFTHPDTRIYGIDSQVHHVGVADHRCKLIACDHESDDLGLLFPIGSVDVVVDDGCHKPWVQRKSHAMLWPALKSGGQYWVEDINCFPRFYQNDGPGGDVLRHWLTMPQSRVWANFLDGFGNYRDDDVLVMVVKP